MSVMRSCWHLPGVDAEELAMQHDGAVLRVRAVREVERKVTL